MTPVDACISNTVLDDFINSHPVKPSLELPNYTADGATNDEVAPVCKRIIQSNLQILKRKAKSSGFFFT